MGDKRSERMLEEVVKLPGNNYCADCHSPSPRWASVNLGITLCVSCATIHRKLGTHKSRVKSITLDTWTRDQISSLRQIGNNASNAIYNPNESQHPPPTSQSADERDSEMEKYIRKKYEIGAFKAGASGSAVVGNSRDRYRASQGLSTPTQSQRTGVMENRRNPELNDLVFKKKSPEKRDAERELPPLPLYASRTGSSSGAVPRERPKPTTTPTPMSNNGRLAVQNETLINLGGGTTSTLPLQLQPQVQQQPQQQQQTTFNQNQDQAIPMYIPQQQQQQPTFQPQSMNSIGNGNGNGNSFNGSYIHHSTTPIQSPPSFMQQQNQYFNNPFMQQQPQQGGFSNGTQQNAFLSPGGYGMGMATSPGGTNPFLQMQMQQQQMTGYGQGQGFPQGQGQGQGQGLGKMSGSWNGQQSQGQPQGQGQWQSQQPQQGMYMGPGMGMGMGMGYAQGH